MPKENKENKKNKPRSFGQQHHINKWAFQKGFVWARWPGMETEEKVKYINSLPLDERFRVQHSNRNRSPSKWHYQSKPRKPQQKKMKPVPSTSKITNFFPTIANPQQQDTQTTEIDDERKLI